MFWKRPTSAHPKRNKYHDANLLFSQHWELYFCVRWTLKHTSDEVSSVWPPPKRTHGSIVALSPAQRFLTDRGQSQTLHQTENNRLFTSEPSPLDYYSIASGIKVYPPSTVPLAPHRPGEGGGAASSIPQWLVGGRQCGNPFVTLTRTGQPAGVAEGDPKTYTDALCYYLESGKGVQYSVRIQKVGEFSS